MEILLEPTSNKLMVERFDNSARNPVKEILLKWNLPDHRFILTDSKEYLKMVMEQQSIKVKEIQERCIIKAFQDYQIKKCMNMSVQKSQDSRDGKVYKMAKQDYTWLMISRSSKITFYELKTEVEA
ncbi:hypothetical protein Tco_0837695 [Tanacetum coccineum]